MFSGFLTPVTLALGWAFWMATSHAQQPPRSACKCGNANHDVSTDAGCELSLYGAGSLVAATDEADAAMEAVVWTLPRASRPGASSVHRALK